LLNICINDLFINTREDIGPCGKIHSEALRADFEKESQKKDYRIEEEVLDYLKDFIVKNERKIVTNKKRLEAEESPELEAKAQEMHDLGIQIGEKLAKAETLGNEGKVDESLAMMTEVEELKKKRKDAEDHYRAHIPLGSNQQQKLRACDVCGAFLSLYDNDRRLADHFGGKLHLGFVQIKEKITELEERIENKRERKRSERERDRESPVRRRRTRSRSGSREQSRERRSYRRKSRSRSPERSKKRRSRSRDRSRRSRSRSRDRSRKNRSRSRDRSRKHRSRSRDRSRRSRSRSKERSRKGRSRSRERSKSENKRHRRSRSRS
jgi:RNA-binding protein Luc7-like 2